MENGIYVRRELKVITYERGDDIFVVVINDEMPDQPIVMHGESARDLVLSLMDHLE